MTREAIQSEFGKNAGDYVTSAVHASGASLERMVALCKPGPDWNVLDVATGAGHTAFAFAHHVRSVVATDLTQEMLALTGQGARERGLDNVTTEYAEAGELSFEDRTFDLVTCRIAAHHFEDTGAFLNESFRVLRPGGVFALVDNVVPEGEAGAYVNAYEKLRDPSHGRCLSRADWEAGCAGAGLRIEAIELLRKRLKFSFWAGRHDPDVRSYLLAILNRAAGEAAEFLAPETIDGELHFHLSELLLVARKPPG